MSDHWKRKSNATGGLEARGAITEIYQKIPDLLRGPRPVWVRGDPPGCGRGGPPSGQHCPEGARTVRNR
jgi:hypothetical protein